MDHDRCGFEVGAFVPCSVLLGETDKYESFRIVIYWTTGDDRKAYLGVSHNGRSISYCPFCGASVEVPCIGTGG